MKKNKLLIGIIVATVSLSSCNTAENNAVKKDAKENISNNVYVLTASTSAVNTPHKDIHCEKDSSNNSTSNSSSSDIKLQK
jgi:hypothetical protein